MEHLYHPRAPVGVHHKAWEHTALKVLSWGGIGIAGLALTPVLFSGVKSGALGQAAADAITFCTSGTAKGWAASASGLLKDIGFSESIAAGGLATAALSGGIALGGMLLANYIDKRTAQGEFRWGSVIRWASLATSILIALPAILPAIGMGVMFFAALMGPPNVLSSAAVSIGSLGQAGAMSGMSGAMGAAGLAGIHALTCALPLGLTGFFLGQKEEKQPKPMLKLALPAQAEGRVMPQQSLVRATA